jgi:hypothetical protein
MINKIKYKEIMKISENLILNKTDRLENKDRSAWI